MVCHWANSIRTEERTQPLASSDFGSTSASGVVTAIRGRSTPAMPPTTSTTKKYARNFTTRLVGSSRSVRLPTYSRTTIAASMSSRRRTKARIRPRPISGGSALGTVASSMTTPTRPRKHSSSQAKTGAGMRTRPRRNSSSAIGMASSGTQARVRPSSQPTGYSTIIANSAQSRAGIGSRWPRRCSTAASGGSARACSGGAATPRETAASPVAAVSPGVRPAAVLTRRSPSRSRAAAGSRSDRVTAAPRTAPGRGG
ncbi:hypothetical protein ACFQZ4_23105 [Catellatospora coxensis]